jgi:hypothetical protein
MPRPGELELGCDPFWVSKATQATCVDFTRDGGSQALVRVAPAAFQIVETPVTAPNRREVPGRDLQFETHGPRACKAIVASVRIPRDGKMTGGP